MDLILMHFEINHRNAWDFCLFVSFYKKGTTPPLNFAYYTMTSLLRCAGAKPRRVSAITHLTQVRNFRPKKVENLKKYQNTKKVDTESGLGITYNYLRIFYVNSTDVFLFVSACIHSFNPWFTLGLNKGEQCT